MNYLPPRSLERVAGVEFSEDSLRVALVDGSTLIVSLAWYPRLLNATPQQRKRWRVSSNGYQIHWPELNEHFCAKGLLSAQSTKALPLTPLPPVRSFGYA
jgi:Protein of unknown function (DUF2442)